MTYCVGMVLNQGLVFMSDTRTNAGLDNVSTFQKMFHWEIPGERMMTLMTAGNLGTTQAVVSLLEERSKAHDDRAPALLDVPSMFQAARLVADTLRDVVSSHKKNGQSEKAFHGTLILGGQIKGGPPRLFLIYPEGNFIEAGEDSPFFQIGEMKYGRPILVRAYDADMSFENAIKLLLVSFDSTLKANLTVGMPIDYHAYAADTLRKGAMDRIQDDNPYFRDISESWGDALKHALDSLNTFSIERH